MVRQETRTDLRVGGRADVVPLVQEDGEQGQLDPGAERQPCRGRGAALQRRQGPQHRPTHRRSEVSRVLTAISTTTPCSDARRTSGRWPPGPQTQDLRKTGPALAPQRGTPAQYGVGVDGDWRTATIGRLRSLILTAEPDIVEEAKWRKASNPDGVPTFSCAGLVCTLETYKDKVKLTFAHGASLADSSGLFNASLDAGTRRAIDVHEGVVLDESAFVELVREAVALNRS